MPNSTVLAADVGGTKSDFALFVESKGVLHCIREARYRSQDYSSFSSMANLFLEREIRPSRLSVAFAGPVVQGKAKATNLDWSIDADKLRADLGIPEVFIINDLEGGAYGLAALAPDAFLTVHPGRPVGSGHAGILAPGTGLGAAGLFWNGAAFIPFATEGGHTDFAPREDVDWQLLQYLQNQFGHVSWERVLSGPGIRHIFDFLRNFKGWEVPDWLDEALQKQDSPAAISRSAELGCRIGTETLRLFIRYLAASVSNLALMFNATGGIYLGGGILPKIWNPVLQAVFLEHFVQVGRLRPLMDAVPVRLILHPKIALLGAALYSVGRPEAVSLQR